MIINNNITTLSDYNTFIYYVIQTDCIILSKCIPPINIYISKCSNLVN